MITVPQIQRRYYLIITLFWLSVGLPLALMVLLIQARGLDLFQIGILMGVYSLTIVLLEIPTGGLADTIGRKPVAITAYSFMFISGIVMLLAFSFGAFLLAWVLNAIGRALASGSLDAWFVDALQAVDPNVDIQPALAKAGTFTLLALGVGTLVGGLVPYLFPGLPPEGTSILTPYSMTVVLSLFVKLFLIAAVVILVRENWQATEGDNLVNGFKQMPVIISDAVNLSRHNTTLVLLLVIGLISGLALASIETFWSPRFADLLGGIEGNSFVFGLVMAGNFLAGMAGNLGSVSLSRRLKKRYGLLGAIFQGAQAILLILLAMQAGIIPAIGIFWMIYLSMGVINSPHATLVNNEIPAERRSSMLSVQSLMAYLGGIMGSFVLGFIANRISISAAWIAAGSLLLISSLIYLQVDRQSAKVAEYDGSKTAIFTTD
jgi:DHA1 family quinolone resistance protein-like MFS transporter